MTGAAQREYQPQYRQRTKAGLCVLRVQVDAVAWVEALIYAECCSPPAIEAATARVIELLPELDRLNGLGR